MGIGNRILIKSIKGQKEYYCDLCGERIRAGEHYTRGHCQKDGKFITRKYCITHSWKVINADMREARDNMSPPSQGRGLKHDTDAWHDQERRNEDQKEEDADEESRPRRP